jgi:subtilisin-like proprotein convertase family protein
MSTPNDPFLPLQWHFGLMGNIERIWEEYSGAGVHVGVYDDGVDMDHEDLADNYDASLHVSVGGVTYVGDYDPVDGAHGTAVAGLIGAVGDNGLGGRGVAHGAFITGVNIFRGDAIDVNFGEDFFGAMLDGVNFDVINNSWNATPFFLPDQNMNIEGTFNNELNATYELLTILGRDGFGTVIVQSAGNDDLITGGVGTNASRYTVTVAATDGAGFATWYSNYGPDILVTAPAADFTTDNSGEDGYGPIGYTGSFGGTSASAPVTSGVVALMLEANPELSWRDVHNILASSASHTGSAIGAEELGTFENFGWGINAASNWNGGGMHYSPDYGYGMVNAYNAVRMAEAWQYFDQGMTGVSGFSSAISSTDVAIEDLGIATSTATATQSGQVEWVRVTVDLQHSYGADMIISLTSAAGSTIVLYDGSGGGSFWADDRTGWSFGVEAFRGEEAAGDWTLTIEDTFEGDSGTLFAFTVQIYGLKEVAATNDLYTYTDEFALMLAADEGNRRIMSDTDGGSDTINLAAVSTDVIVSLAGAETDGRITFGGRRVTIEAGTQIEAVVTGDGDDQLYGSGAADELRGMRGDDVLDGRGGNDSLYGGMGNDGYVVDSASDRVFELAGQGDDTIRTSVSYSLGSGQEIEMLFAATSAGAVVLRGNSFDNMIVGASGDDSLSGGGGNDNVRGGSGNDVLSGGTGTDRIIGGEGADQLFGNDGNDSLTGGAGNDILTGGLGDDSLRGSGGADIFRFAASGQGADVLEFFNALDGDRIDLAGSSLFTALSFVDADGVGGANDARLVYAGGTITALNAGASGTLADWNALVV